ncbi:MAG: FAD:protein FMN transferase [Planctomycetaceae bacterium]
MTSGHYRLTSLFMGMPVVLLFTSLTMAADAMKISGTTMGTVYSVVIDSPSSTLGSAEQVQAKIEARLDDINARMSTWQSDSEISRFNASDSTDWFPISPEFAVVVAEARRIHDATQGAFDPTVAPLIQLWGFGDHRRRTIPDDEAIQSALKSVGMQNLEVRSDPPALRKQIPALQLNLSAIAKGYGVDAVAELLVSLGQRSYVVDIGGENRAGESRANGNPWRLGIESSAGDLLRVMRLTETSIATSGDYRNYFEVDGVRYSHAINPSTGRPVDHPPAAVSVIHSSCMTADGWATAMMVLGPEKGRQVAEREGLSVLFQVPDKDGEVQLIATGRFIDQPELSAEQSVDHFQHVPEDGTQSPRKTSAKWFPFAAAAVIFLIAVAGMSIGTMLQNRQLKGSCGGLASLPGSEGKSICELCTIPKDQCTNAELREKLQAAAQQNAEDEG